MVAPRKVSKAELDAATTRIGNRRAWYESKGIYLSTYGGFAADFDGVKVMVDEKKSTLKDVAAIRNLIEADARVPVSVSLGTAAVF